jgi:hypothetical protein
MWKQIAESWPFEIDSFELILTHTYSYTSIQISQLLYGLFKPTFDHASMVELNTHIEVIIIYPFTNYWYCKCLFF